MRKIPVRHIARSEKEPASSEKFNIRDLSVLLNGEDLFQDLHRHNFYFILALQKGMGTHEIDFKRHPVLDNSVFFLRPGSGRCAGVFFLFPWPYSGNHETGYYGYQKSVLGAGTGQVIKVN